MAGSENNGRGGVVSPASPTSSILSFTPSIRLPKADICGNALCPSPTKHNTSRCYGPVQQTGPHTGTIQGCFCGKDNHLPEFCYRLLNLTREAREEELFQRLQIDRQGLAPLATRVYQYNDPQRRLKTPVLSPQQAFELQRKGMLHLLRGHWERSGSEMSRRAPRRDRDRRSGYAASVHASNTFQQPVSGIEKIRVDFEARERMIIERSKRLAQVNNKNSSEEEEDESTFEPAQAKPQVEIFTKEIPEFEIDDDEEEDPAETTDEITSIEPLTSSDLDLEDNNSLESAYPLVVSELDGSNPLESVQPLIISEFDGDNLMDTGISGSNVFGNWTALL